MNTNETRTKKTFRMPNAFVILLLVIAAVSLLTYVIPAGIYNQTPNAGGYMVADPDSYHLVEQSPVTFRQFLTAIPTGFVEAAWPIAMTLFVGAAFAVVQKIGLIPAAIEHLAHKYSTKGTLVIPFMMFVFAMIDSFIGTPELVVIYIPIVMPLMIRLGFDSVTAVATVLCGSAAGFSAALTNPFTVAIGQQISGLPLYSATWYRIITFVVTWGIGALYLMRYAKKIQANPSLSNTWKEDEAKREKYCGAGYSAQAGRKLNGRQKAAAGFSAAMFLLMLVGMILFKWDMPEMCAIFLVMGVGAGLIVRMNVDELCDTLVQGCSDMMLGALVIGASRAISVVMTEANIIHSVVHALASVLTDLPKVITVLGILLAVTLLNFLIPSGSGKAVVLFPILAPLADIVGLTRQTCVLAYQFGDGFTNYLWPTVGYFMAGLSIGGVSWQKWTRFYFPLFLMWLCSSTAFLMIAQLIHLGPF